MDLVRLLQGKGDENPSITSPAGVAEEQGKAAPAQPPPDEYSFARVARALQSADFTTRWPENGVVTFCENATDKYPAISVYKEEDTITYIEGGAIAVPLFKAVKGLSKDARDELGKQITDLYFGWVRDLDQSLRMITRDSTTEVSVLKKAAIDGSLYHKASNLSDKALSKTGKYSGGL